MSEPGTPPTPTPEGRLPDKVLVLALATFLLLTPPVVAVFDIAVPILGMPLLHVFTFSVWVIAIVLGGLMARRLVLTDTPKPPADGGG